MSRFTENLRSLFGHGPNRADDTPPVVSQATAAALLKVDERARKDAVHQIPPADAEGPGTSEQAIVDWHRKALATLNAWFARRRARIEHLLSDLRERLDERHLDECVASLEQNLTGLRLRIAGPLTEARENERRAERELRAFKDANGLDRDPRQPESLYLHYALLAFVLLVEGVVNAWAFGVGSWGGWVGGLQQALVVAAINLAVAFAAGLVARQMVHVKPWHKAVGIGMALAYALFLTGYTLLIGHYRAALASNPDQAVTAAIERLTSAPFAIGDVYTVLLMIASAGFAAVALITAIKTRDVYPGYTEVFLRHRKALRHLQALREHYLARVDALFLHQPQILEARLAKAREARSQFRQTIEAARHLSDRYLHAGQEIAASCSSLLGRYRAVNERVRTAPAPAYFAGDRQVLGAGDLLETDSAAVAEALRFAERQAQAAGDLETRAAELKVEINRRYSACLEEAPAFFAHTDALATGQAAHVAAPAVTKTGEAAPALSGSTRLAVVGG